MDILDSHTLTFFAFRDPAPYIRLPGGSDNLVASKSNLQSIKKTLKERGINYVDWNVSAGDAIPNSSFYRNSKEKGNKSM